MGKIRPVQPDDELSLVEHLDELRTRIVILLVGFCAIFAVCFWQNHHVLSIVNGPLPDGKIPSTFAVSEAFMSTLTVSAYAALIITSPLIMYQVWAFVVPAFSAEEKRVARPLVLLTPFLFICGCVFGYYVVLPAALSFLLGFNDQDFNILLRASDYYSFFGLTVLAMGLLFEMPLAILIAARMGLVTAQQLRENRRYAIVIIAIVAMLLPGVDPVSMLIEMVPLLLLFELSIWLTVWFGKPRSAGEESPAPKSPEPGTAMR
ncbi:MAG: twin-arginine translocase subunit TatC [Solirubrobacterales bacterium]